MTTMATNQLSLTKGWIQFLKNNQIANSNSDPKTGRINYNRQPTVTDLLNYLGDSFDRKIVMRAIKSVLNANTEDNPEGGEIAPQDSNNTATANTPATNQNASPAGSQGKKYNNDDAEDAKYSQRGVTPYNANNKPSTWHNSEVTPSPQGQIGAETQWRAKPKKYNNDDADDVHDKNSQSKIKEAIRDAQGSTLSERQIQDIFKILANPEPIAKDATGGANNGQQQGQASQNNANSAAPQNSVEELNKIKRVIRDTMSNSQRLALYRALTDV